ncbi:MAG: SDR family NAD(P)-dependent oxidoreductase [Beijerinckiaceae bacterium]
MNTTKEVRNALPALITGASGGLGADLARVFARNGHRLALVARSRDGLDALAAELRREFNADVTVAAMDLSEAGACARLKAELDAAGFEPAILVNNAGFGLISRFEDQDSGQLANMVDLNCRALTELTSVFLPPIAAARGKILNVASLASYYAGPGAATYYATKAYVLSLSRALAYELKGAGVTVTALCPGPTRTRFFDRASGGTNPMKGMAMMESMPVAETGYRALMAGRREAVPGLQNWVLAFFSGVTPQWIALPFVGAIQLRRRNQSSPS